MLYHAYCICFIVRKGSYVGVVNDTKSAVGSSISSFKDSMAEGQIRAGNVR